MENLSSAHHPSGKKETEEMNPVGDEDEHEDEELQSRLQALGVENMQHTGPTNQESELVWDQLNNLESRRQATNVRQRAVAGTSLSGNAENNSNAAQKALFPENTVPADFKVFEKITSEDLSQGKNLLLKKVVRKGKGEKIGKGKIAVVHYSGYLTSGLKFDCSRDRNKPFKFFVGLGRVIEGWDKGIETMKIGERAVLTCAPEYGYGSNGVSQVIPANSTLVFDIELLEIQEENRIWKLARYLFLGFLMLVMVFLALKCYTYILGMLFPQA